MIAEDERIVESSDDLAGEHFDLVLVAYGLHQADEFVATKAGQHVDQTDPIGEPGCNRHQQLVTDTMAEGIVDLLELIKVDEENGQALTFGIFVQGFNVIIRIMMFFPNAAKSVGDSIIVNWPYIFFSLLGLGISMFLMLRLDRSDVRVTMTK